MLFPHLFFKFCRLNGSCNSKLLNVYVMVAITHVNANFPKGIKSDNKTPYIIIVNCHDA